MKGVTGTWAAALLMMCVSPGAPAAEIKVVTEYRYPTAFTVEPIVGGGGGAGFNVARPVGAVVEPSDFVTREVGTRLSVYATTASRAPRYSALRRRIEQKTLHGNTDLMLASTRGDTPEVKRLLAAGATVNAKNRQGSTALMGAAAGGFDDVLQLLLDRKADANSLSDKGSTALMFAAKNGHAQSVARLLENGARVNATDIGGRSALMHAISRGHTPTARLLLKHGADIMLQDRNGNDALRLASAQRDRDLVVLLTRAQAGR